VESDDEGATGWRWTATKVSKGGGGGVSSRSDQSRANFEQVFWHAENNTGVILRPQTPQSNPSQNKTAQSDVTAETAQNLR
jgi:hypothetical protein